MNILSYEEKSNIKRAICLGRFDGLHIGHKKLIAVAASIAERSGLELSLFTIRPTERAEEILCFEEFCSECSDLGIKSIICAKASPEFFDVGAVEFLSALKDRFSAEYLVCGEDFTYGRNRSGNATALAEFCNKNRIGYSVVDILVKGDKKVSSTDIRALLKRGDVATASQLLGEYYKVTGVVSVGRKDGRKLGFSTANTEYPEDKIKVSRGVYATKTLIDGREYDSITNFGPAPTFGIESDLLETHIIGFSGDLYGKTITVKFVDFLRENKKFSDKSELIEQLKKDIRYYD